MLSESSGMQAILSRLSRLETQNRKLKMFGLALSLAFGATVMMGLSAPKPPVPEVIEAQRFVLKDGEGNVRAWLGLFGEGSELTLGNLKNQPKMTLKVSDEGSDLHLFGRQNSGMNLGLDFGAPAIVMVGASRSGQAALGIAESGPALSLEDARKTSVIVGSSQVGAASSNKLHQGSAASVILLDKNKKVIWQAP